ncbi:hypothetical protein H8I91_11985 [Serratia fonticola]|uniref:phage tail tape measure protein n=1 Tax=Serratia fonticola TaxID=47917 RepID=UPI00164866DA|nr:hypothetical protein [Serratia fonticola]MBC3250985.1 hypothetical protein [Serratia fonticola]
MSSSKDLRLQVVLSAVDRLTRPLKSVQASNKRLAAAIKATKDQLKKLNNQAGDIAAFKKNKQALSNLADRMQRNQERIRSLSVAIKQQGDETGKLIRRQQNAIAYAGRMKERYDALNGTLQKERTALSEAGINTRNLAAAQNQLNKQTQAATAALNRQEKSLKTRGAALDKYQRVKSTQHSMAMGGAMTMAKGGVALYAMHPMINESAAYNQQVYKFRQQGVSQQQIDNAQQFVSSHRVVGNSQTELIKQYAESYAITRNERHAQDATVQLARAETAIKFLGNNGMLTPEQVETFNNMSYALLKSAESRNEIQDPKQLAAFINESVKGFAVSQGTVSPSDINDFINIGGFQAKHIDTKEMLYGFGHLIQERGGQSVGNAVNSGYQNWVNKRTKTAAKDEMNKIGMLQNVTYSKAGHVTDFEIKNQDKFITHPLQYVMEDVVPKIIKAHPGINEIGIQKELNKIFSDRTAGDLYSAAYAQRTNINKQMDAGNKVQDVSTIIRQAKDTPGGQELILEAKKHDLYKQIGDKLLPLYVKGLTLVSGALDKISGFFDRHPQMAKFFIVGAASMAIAATAAGALTLALAGMLGPLAIMRYGFTMLSGKELPALGRMFKWLNLRAIGRAFIALGKSPLKLGRLFSWLARSPITLVRVAFAGLEEALFAIGAAVAALGWPITLLIGALVAGGIWIYKNWDRVKAFFQGFAVALAPAWKAIKGLFERLFAPLKPAMEWLEDKLGKAVTWFENLLTPVHHTKKELDDAADAGKKFGAYISESIVTAIGWIEKLMDKITWVLDKLNAIRDERRKTDPSFGKPISPAGFSPDAKFDRGGYLPRGKIGLVGENGPELINGPARITSRRHTAAMAAMTMLAMSTPVHADAKLPYHPYARPAKQIVQVKGDSKSQQPVYLTPHIHIHAAPQQSAEDIAKEVMRQLNILQRQASTRGRSNYRDQE